MPHLSRRLALALVLSCFILLFTLGSAVAQGPGPKPVHLIGGDVVLAHIPPANASAAASGEFDGVYFKLIQFSQLPAATERTAWSAAGLRLVDYLPDNTYFAVIRQDFDLGRLAGRALTVVDVPDGVRVEPSLATRLARGETATRLIVSYYAGLAPQKVMANLRTHGATITAHRSYSYQLDITIDPARLAEIVARPYLEFLGLPPEAPVLEGYDHRNATGRSNYLNTGYNGLNYNGAGVVVGIGEGGTVDNLVDVKGRLTEMVVDVPSDHKIGVMKNSGGAGTLDPSNRNNAWGATFLSIAAYPDYAGLYNSANLRYTNHSYGTADPSNGYDQTARDHDLRIAAYPNHLVIYSSGNSGASTGAAPYAFPTWATITGAMKENKNEFSVGALDPSTDALTGFSSRGPTYDGRIIPQVVIEGVEGTSDAAPKVTGQVAMLAQVYKDKNGGAEPQSTLPRAILMNTADEMDDPGPDFKTGYGRTNLRRAYNVINNAQYLSGSVSNGGTNTHTLVVPANTAQVRVMLIWPDVAAAVNANPALVNNLNLVAVDPGSTNYNPWVLDSTPTVAAIDAPATRGVDNLNTYEQVTVDNPAAGAWTLQVSGASVPQGPQAYFITYEFLTDELTMTFPLKDHRFISSTTYQLKWDSYGPSGTFALDYQLDGGSWTNIVTGYSATSRNYSWTAPAVSGIHTIKFRVRRGALTSESDVNYIGPATDNFRIFSVCSDQVILKWSAVSGATAYKVYRLGSTYMEEVTSNITFNGTSATLTGQSLTGSEYYAVSAVTGSYEGQRTLAVEKTPGDYSCGGISWTGAVSTDWFTAGNWSSGAAPTSADNVIIPAAPANQPVIGAAGAACNRITIDNGATVTMSGASAYTFSVAGDWINNGTFSRGIGTVEFSGTNSYQQITGASTTNFNILSVAKGAKDRILEATSLITLNAGSNPLALTSGTLKISSASTLSPFTTGPSIGSTAGFWNNGGTINAGNYGWTLNAGLLRISAGTVNVGTSSGNTITYLNNGTLIMEGGALNIAGRFSPNSGTSAGTFTQSGGVITVNTVGSTSTSRAPLELNAGVPFTMNGGTIVVRRASSNAADVIILSTTYEVTGGTLQIGDASTPAGQTIRINSTAPVYNLVVNATNSPTAQLVTNGLTVKHDVTLWGGTLNANGLTMNVGGNWTNNGAFTHGNGAVHFNGFGAQAVGGSSISSFFDIFLESANSVTGPAGNMNVAGNWTNNGGYLHNGGSVTLNGSAAQTIGGAASATFNNLTVNNTGSGVTLARNQTVNRLLTLTSGNLDLGGNTLTLATTTDGNGVTATGARSMTGSGTVAMTAARTISGGTLAFGPNVTVRISDGVDFGAGGLSTINGVLLINGGGYVQAGKAPIYGSGSTLKYDTGGAYGAYEEWYSNTTSGPGVPQNVEIATGTALNFGNSGFARTARGNVTINGNLALSTAVGGDLNVGGNWVNNGAFNHNSRAVQFNGVSAQTVGGSTDATFAYLTINNAAGVSLNRPALVNNQLSLTNGLLTLGSSNMTLAASAAPISGGTFGNARMIVADGAGALCKQFTNTGSFDYPIGDATDAAEYSPATLNFTSGAYAAGAQACVRVVDAAHLNGDQVNYPTYITRYWPVTQSGISGFSCAATFTYVENDEVIGNGQSPTALYHWSYNGSTWSMHDQVNAATNTLSGVVSSFSDQTARSSTPLAVELAGFSAERTDAGLVLTWETVSEAETAGFNLYRSADGGAKWQRLNAALVPTTAPGGPGGGRYTWTDSAAPRNAALQYQLEQEDLVGARQVLATVVVTPVEFPRVWLPLIRH